MNKPAQRPLEDRVRAIEDRLEIYNLIASHPPSADTGADFYARAVYAEDGVFDRGDKPGGVGVDDYAKMMTGPEHTKALEGGLGHFAGLPYIELDGDRATVTSYLQILTPAQGEPVAVPNHGSSKGFRIHRLAANRWELKRTAKGWRIARRTLRPLDGTPPARELLKGALGKFAN
ncbi:MAG: nuclear transport factor 2 family protein [Xanthobacteraceae bacterium]